MKQNYIKQVDAECREFTENVMVTLMSEGSGFQQQYKVCRNGEK